jgi:uncharacterized membrane protein YhaH (DUF805 family)
MATYRDLHDEQIGGSDDPVGIDALLQFEGRVNRSTFWVTWLGLGAAVLGAAFGASVFIPQVVTQGYAPLTLIAATLIFVFSLLLIVLSLANQAKRWHDIGKSAWWMLLNLVPGIGLLVHLVLGLLPGTEGPNRYGSGPLKIRLNTPP